MDILRAHNARRFLHFCLHAICEHFLAAANGFDAELFKLVLDARRRKHRVHLAVISLIAVLGVPAGANNPNQTVVSKPGRAVSEIVGTLGRTGARRVPATPSTRMVPASM